MTNDTVMPELKQIVGAMIFGANRPLSLNELRKCVLEVAAEDGPARVYGEITRNNLREAVEELAADLQKMQPGFLLVEVAGGLRFQSDARCGIWLRHLLNAGRPNRLSQPALETLAIIAYRQPVTKSVIESIRGVNVDHIIKMLMEMQLVRIAGRSDLPGKPFLFGTTQSFLEHFGLKTLDDLIDIDPMLAGEQKPKGAGKPRPAEPEGAEPDAAAVRDEAAVVAEDADAAAAGTADEAAVDEEDEPGADATADEEDADEAGVAVDELEDGADEEEDGADEADEEEDEFEDDDEDEDDEWEEDEDDGEDAR